MIISVIGYMGSGKTHISKVLAKKINFELFDLDKEISRRNKMTIPEIFEKKGEIYFRKQEREVLEEVLAQQKDCILSTGGGTPVYYNNMEIMNYSSKTIYLRCSIGTLVERLQRQKDKRPLLKNISDEDLPEFIAKHLFERNPFYTKAQHIVDTDGKDPEILVEEIIKLLD